MSKLAEEVRESYERQQAGLGDVSGAHHRLIRNALTAPSRESHRLQWAAGIAAVLIAAIVIATFALTRTSVRPHATPAATPSAKAQTSPTPLANTLSVPDSTPLVLYSDPANSAQVDGVTWDGKSAGKMPYQKVAQVAGPGNPQNNLFAGTGTITDRSGNTVMTGTFGLKFFDGTWADDGRHLCQMLPFDNPGDTGVPTTLQLVTVGQGMRDVARIGTLHNQTSVRVAACSVQSDRAVVVQSGGQGIGTAQFWVVQLSTGKILWTRSLDTGNNATVVASHDGMYVAENINNPGSAIYGPDGRVITVLSAQVEAFSWDGNLAVVDAGYGSTPVDLISWRVGTVLWSCPPGTALIQALPEPNGPELAIRVAPTGEFQQQTQFPDLFLVGADGSVTFHVARTGGGA